MTRALIVRNPLAGGRAARKFGQVLSELRRGDYDVEVQDTAEAGHASELARTAASEHQADLVFACGGDGTIREVAAGLLGTELPLALLPNGTTNVLAGALEVPCDALQAARLYSSGKPTRREIDVGTCDDQIFLMMASGGPDAVALSQTDPLLKRRLGKAAVAGSALKTIVTTDLPELGLRIGPHRETATLFSASNIPYYGGKFVLAPDASLDDGCLDLVLFRGTTRSSLAAFVIALLRARHHDRHDVSIRKVQHLVVESPGEITMQLDGDPFRAKTPVSIGMADERLTVMLPNPSA